MNQQNVQMFLQANQSKFKPEQIPMLTQQLINLPDEQYMAVSSASYKDPTVSLILSICLGGLGVDRFYIGDTGMGVLKLLTGGCLGVLTIIDWFTISGKTKDANMKIMQDAINMSATINGAMGNAYGQQNVYGQQNAYGQQYVPQQTYGSQQYPQQPQYVPQQAQQPQQGEQYPPQY